jgi:cytochrome b subunit of formate dehydrogenase
MEKDEKDHEEINLKVWIWMAVIDNVAIVITGLLIFSRHGQSSFRHLSRRMGRWNRKMSLTRRSYLD